MSQNAVGMQVLFAVGGRLGPNWVCWVKIGSHVHQNWVKHGMPGELKGSRGSLG